MYGLSEAQSGRAMVQIAPGQISLAVALAASLHLAAIVLTTLKFYIEVPPLDTIYLKLVAEGDGVALSASEPTLKLSSLITPPAMANQARPTTDLLTGKLIPKLDEATKQNTLVVEEIWSDNVTVPSQLTPITSPKSASAKSNIELAPSGKPKSVPASTTTMNDVTMLQTPPTLSFMSSPQATEKQADNQKPVNSIRTSLIEPPRLNIPVPAPNSSHPSWPDTHVASTHALAFSTRHSRNIGNLSAPINVIPALTFLKKPNIARLGIINVETQKRIVVMERPMESAAYPLRASATIAEPLNLNKTVRALIAKPSKIPTTEKDPPAEPLPDPLALVLRKIAEMEENQKTRDMPRTIAAQTTSSSVDQIMVKARPVEGADGNPLDSGIAKLINSQIIANWRLPPGLMDADLQPVFFRVLLDRTGAVTLIQYLDKLDGTNERYRAFSESAYRAVSKTETFIGLPPNEFDKWRELRLKFDLGS